MRWRDLTLLSLLRDVLALVVGAEQQDVEHGRSNELARFV